MVWTDRLNKDDHINKRSPLTKSLSSLDNWLFMSVNKKYMDLGNSYPITAAYKARPDGPPDKQGQANKSGDKKQPAGDELLGPGTFVEVEPPGPGETDMMANPVQIIAPDVSSLEYHTKMIEDKRNDIFINVVGREDDRTNDQAKNEMQVMSAVESREEVLMSYKHNFEIIERFSTETIARLRYDDKFDSCSVDYGSQFFLKSLSSLQEDYREAQEAGSDPVILEGIKDDILNYRYRNNPTGRIRAELITDLTPFRDKSLSDLIELNNAQLINPDDLTIRINLLDFIARFERENLPLSVYGEKMEYRKKLEKIRNVLVGYAKEKTAPQGELN